MKKISLKRLWPLLLAGVLSLYGCKDDDPAPVVQNIYLLGRNTAGLDSFVRAVDLAGLQEAIAQGNLRTNNGKTYTVFAPNNEAFTALLTSLDMKGLEQIPKATLTEVLGTHILAGTAFREDLQPTNIVTALNGQRLEVLMSGEDSVVSVRVLEPLSTASRTQTSEPSWDVYATVKRPDLRASNGVVHVIDKVLMPKGKVE